MAKFERHFATEQAEPQTFPRAPVSQLADTGQGLEARALAQVGGGLMDVSQIVMKWYEREGNSQLDKAVGEAQNKMGEFERTVFANADEHDTAFKKLMDKTIPGLAGKNKSGARKFKALISGSQKAKWQKTADEKKIRMIAGNNLTGYLDDMRNVAKDYTNKEEAILRLKVLTKGAIDDKTRTQDQVASDYPKALENWTRADIWRRATAIKRPPDAEGNIEVDWQQTVKWFGQAENIKGIDSGIISGLLNKAKSQLTSQQRQDADNLKKLQETQLDNIYKLIDANDGEVFDAIENSSFSIEEKRKLEQLAKNPDVPLNYHEYDKVADIIDGVAKGTHTEEQADIAIKDGVGKYFDTTIAGSLRTKLSQNTKVGSPTRRPAHTRALTAIEEIMDARIRLAKEAGGYGLEEESTDLQTKQKLKNDLEAWVLEKDRTDEEIEKKVKLLTTPIKGEVVRGMFGNLLELFIIGTGGRGFLPRRTKEPETFKHIAINPDTGERMGSNDGVNWQPIP